MAQTPPQYTYSPPPPELPYYNGLFLTADQQSSGYLSGPQAVEFLSLSKLPVDLLKTIWTMADQPASNTLDANKFHVAVRLIQLFQNGKKPVDLALNVGEGEVPMRAPFFEGVNVQQAMAAAQPQQQQQPPQQQMQQQPSPPMQPQQHPQMASSSQRSPQMQPTMNGHGGASTTLTVQDPYSMTPQELARYEQIFPSYAVPEDPNNPNSPQYVGGGAAVELFSKSGMDRDSLKAIWTMADNPIDNKLDSLEFAIAMHLIVCITKKGLPIPGGALPASLSAVMREVRANQQGGGELPARGMPQQQPSQQNMGMAQQPGMPSPDNMGMGMQQQQSQQQLQMNGGMSQMGQPQMQQGMQGQMDQPQMSMQQQPPQQPQMQGGMSQMGGGMQQPQLQPPPGVGGETVDDAFAGLSNEPVPSVDEYSQVGGMDGGSVISTTGGGMGGGATDGGMSTIGGFGGGQSVAMSMTGFGGLGGQQQLQQQPVIQETPEPSPQPVAPAVQAYGAMPSPPIHQSRQQAQQQQPVQQHQIQQNHNLPPKAPRSPRSSPRAAAAKAIPSGDSSAELLSLREAHQKLQAEMISLRAKAASVSEEEQETQKEIAHLAGEIGRLSLELSDLKEGVMEAKVKLGESVGTLKVQMEKKESLEAQVADTKSAHEALTSATTAVEEANELAMAQQARAVAHAAAAKEEAEYVIPAVPAPAVETADLFSWDAAPVPSGAAEAMSAWGSDAPSVQNDSEPAPAPWGSTDAASVSHSVHSQGGTSAAGGPQTPLRDTDGGRDSMNDYSTGGMGNPNPYGMGMGAMGGGGMDHGGGGGGADLFGGDFMGGAAPPPQQPVMALMGGGVPEPLSFDTGSVAPSVPPSVAPTPVAAAATPDRGYSNVADRGSFASEAPPPAPQPTPTHHQQYAADHQQYAAVTGPPSPTKAELESLKGQTIKAEKSFRSCADLVRSISTEVNKLESAAKKAEADMKAMEDKKDKKKGSFTGGGKKKKAKKEYEKAMEVANQERTKVEEAKAQLLAAEREADKAKNQMEEMRQTYEQMELEAATAASYISVQQSHSMQSNSVAGGYSQQQQGGYSDPFGGGMMHHAPAPTPASGSDPYGGMGLMGGDPGGGGGDYSNPFL